MRSPHYLTTAVDRTVQEYLPELKVGQVCRLEDVSRAQSRAPSCLEARPNTVRPCIRLLCIFFPLVLPRPCLVLPRPCLVLAVHWPSYFAVEERVPFFQGCTFCQRCPCTLVKL